MEGFVVEAQVFGVRPHQALVVSLILIHTNHRNRPTIFIEGLVHFSFWLLVAILQVFVGALQSLSWFWLVVLFELVVVAEMVEEDSNFNFQINQNDHLRCLQCQRSQVHIRLYVYWFSYLNNNSYPLYVFYIKIKNRMIFFYSK